MSTVLFMMLGALMSDVLVVALLLSSKSLRTRVGLALLNYGHKGLKVEEADEDPEYADEENY